MQKHALSKLEVHACDGEHISYQEVALHGEDVLGMCAQTTTVGCCWICHTSQLLRRHRAS